MKENLPNMIAEISTFLGINLEKEKIQSLSDYVSFNSLKKTKAYTMDNPKYGIQLMRNGVTGGWKKEVFTNEQNSLWNDWIDKHLKDFDCDLPHVANCK